ncbi:linear amide C-N hydrolase [Streptomyces avidinii]|uniref:Penicillin V acylase-like amidase (Ntn superfamily) n=1 Tax=Streptomyces avidinii TaxID=1895 RepID=A0ABS4L850_STRAV|nr:linear amide C-N hydrolase [Streptomyces avidinii]MBP2038238.1 penicillin V acylase-like amidase (Ntn superfamily) [Streptomyces avidinii]GGZ13947.1 hypothetical protein GCM10010343_46090 [Streptomyces avidinii]
MRVNPSLTQVSYSPLIAGAYVREDSADPGPRDPGRPGLQIALWIQYLLDGAATVPQALDLLDTCQLVPVEMHGFRATVHVALEDASGDSAIIEYIAGERRVHHDRSYTIMTNEPAYDEQLRLLREQVRTVQELGHDRPSSEVPLPRTVLSRAARPNP